MQKYFFILNYLVLIVFAIIYYKKYINSFYLKLFIYFIIYSFLTEVIGTYISYELKLNSNFIYNTWNIVNHLFYAFFFLSGLASLQKRKAIIGFIIAYIIFSIINILFFRDYFGQILLNNILFGSILIVLVVVIYYSELLSGDAILNIKQSLFFWISVGVLLSNIILIPVWVFAEFFSYQGIFRFLIFASNIIMSLCFITGFIISKKEFNN